LGARLWPGNPLYLYLPVDVSVIVLLKQFYSGLVGSSISIHLFSSHLFLPSVSSTRISYSPGVESFRAYEHNQPIYRDKSRACNFIK
jgi:hypothetical protein